MFVGHWLCIRGNPWHSNAHPTTNPLLRGHAEPGIRRKDSWEKTCFPWLRFHGPAERKRAIIIITQILHAITVGVQVKFHRRVLKGDYRFFQTTGGKEMHGTTKRCEKMWNRQGTQKYFVQLQCTAHGRVGWGKDKDIDTVGPFYTSTYIHACLHTTVWIARIHKRFWQVHLLNCSSGNRYMRSPLLINP